MIANRPGKDDYIPGFRLCATDFYSVCKGSSAIVVPIARLTDKDLIRESLMGPLQELGFLDDTGEPG